MPKLCFRSAKPYYRRAQPHYAFMQQALQTISEQCVSLRELTLTCDWDHPMDLLSFAPLAAMPQLRRLDIHRLPAVISASQMEELRQLSQLEQLVRKHALRLRDLLAPAHRLRLQKVAFIDQQQADIDTLASLPTLTELKLKRVRATHVDALSELPLLGKLSLQFDWAEVDAPRVLASLCRCTHLTQLDICMASAEEGLYLSVEQLTQCCASLPLLRSLTLRCLVPLISLSFLVAGTLPTTLTSLTIDVAAAPLEGLPLAELAHVQKLAGLEKLSLYALFNRPLEAEEIALYTPPSALMPALRTFFCNP